MIVFLKIRYVLFTVFYVNTLKDLFRAMGRKRNKETAFKKAITHEEAQKVVCAVCMMKKTRTDKLNPRSEQLILKHHCPDIDFQNPLLPKSIWEISCKSIQ